MLSHCLNLYRALSILCLHNFELVEINIMLMVCEQKEKMENGSKSKPVYFAFVLAKSVIHEQDEYRLQLCAEEKITCGEEKWVEGR